MPRLEPALPPVVTDLEGVCAHWGVAVVGALIPELVLELRPPYTTNDADVTVAVESLADFETLKDRLAKFGFEVSHYPELPPAYRLSANCQPIAERGRTFGRTLASSLSLNRDPLKLTGAPLLNSPTDRSFGQRG